MNYFELYPGDYLRDTTRLSLVDHGAYLRLLMAYYAEEQPLPADEAELFTIVSAVSAADKAAVRKVAARFFPVGEDGLRRNGRADAEIAKAQRRIETARANGSKNKPGKNPPGNPVGNPVGVPSGNPDGTQRDTRRETRSGEALHTPHATRQDSVGGSEASADIPQGESTEAGRACQLLKAAGCLRLNPSHADLLAALAEGVKPEAIRDCYLENPKATNPFAYAIATARGRHAAGAKPAPGANHVHANGGPSRKLSAVEQVQQAILERRAREQPGDDAPLALGHG